VVGDNGRLGRIALYGHVDIALVCGHASLFAGLQDGAAGIGELQLHGAQFDVIHGINGHGAIGMDKKKM